MSSRIMYIVLKTHSGVHYDCGSTLSGIALYGFGGIHLLSSLFAKQHCVNDVVGEAS